MAQIVTLNDCTVLCINRQLILLDAENGRCGQVVDLPAARPPPKNAAGESNNQEQDDDAAAETADGGDDAAAAPAAADASTKSAVLPVASNRILHAALSPDQQLLAVTTADEKFLHLYRIDAAASLAATAASADSDDSNTTTGEEQRPAFATLLSSRPVARTSNALRFSNDSRLLFVADKTGDVFTFPCEVDAAADTLQQSGTCVLSHLSMVLGVAQSPDGDFILSCDRDEKIRCTRFPRTTVVESYCLGHTEYVAGIELLPTHRETVVVSASGDKTLRLWRYADGKQLERFELPAPALRLAVRQIDGDAGVSHVAVALYEHEHDVAVYEVVAASPAKEFSIRAIGEFQLEGAVHVQSFAFNADGDLLVAAITDADETALFRLSTHADNDAYVLDPLDGLNGALAAQAADLMVPHNAEEVALLFKKRFENLHDYHERKRRRIEDKVDKNQKRNQKKVAAKNGNGSGEVVVLVED